MSDYETQPNEGLEMSQYERAKGKVKFYNQNSGYGFLSRDGGSDVFFHVRELQRSGIGDDLKTGDVLEFDVVPVEGKGPKATEIRLLASGV